MLVAPEISKHPKDTRAVEGQDVVFHCLVEGNPIPRVSWTKNEEELNATVNPRLSSAIINETHTLTITDVHLTDAGQYRCLANNSVAPTTSSAATLIVEEYCKYLIQFTNQIKPRQRIFIFFDFIRKGNLLILQYKQVALWCRSPCFVLLKLPAQAFRAKAQYVTEFNDSKCTLTNSNSQAGFPAHRSKP